MLFPKFIKPGDTIGICAPSAGIGLKLESFDRSLETLHDAGYLTLETESVRSEGYPSAPPDVRGRELNTIFSDDAVDMVICASGGDYCIETLPYIDEDLLAANPKWFLGYSDPTSIEMLLTTKLDIATLYGCNAGSWDLRPLHDFQEISLGMIGGEIPVQYSYEFYSSAGFDEDLGDYNMDAPVNWILLHDEPSLQVTGRLIGGCADVFDWIIGTPYEDLKGFSERYKEDGLIWFFDNFEMSPLNLMYLMIKMKQIGLFDNAVAIVFGRTLIPGDAADEDYLNQLERVFADTDIPLIWNADIGHTKPSMTLINGAMATLTYKDGKASIAMELR